MAVVLVPDFGSELVQCFPWHLSIVLFESVDPRYKVMTLFCGERQDTLF